ncbi:hypothetical protein SDRG_15136 [Saprolegnia diclina VS20]|uniref:Amino acid transporter n=1 Tax=Saprolegnia diclina (strain VS20) TaxID=1156394 RepID=T0RBV1_SAPDV|nr:hypothetical protein SDRG_15136 [Saprolegnia diclina VS20]EQC27022.1 hypothetical protein SDRG_15136 [Saprolegnia diclina VS20]|eukprot:XP_008619522.1 hypothetical protein SDRG_15136 [Saprolegnia diclina VS20]
MSHIPMLATKDEHSLESYDLQILSQRKSSITGSIAADSLFAPTVSDGTALARHQQPPTMENNADDEGATRRSWTHYYVGAPGTLLGAAIGLGLGLFLATDSVKSQLKQYDYAEKLIVRWGALYFRAVSCLLSPIVFVSLARAVADIVASPRMTRMGWRLLAYSFGTTLLAVAQAMAWGYLFADKYDGAEYKFKYSSFSIKCPNTNGLTLGAHKNGTLFCANMTAKQLKANGFPLYDDTKQLVLAPDIRKLVYYESTTQEILHGLLLLTPGNFVGAWYRNEVMSIVIFAMVFGLAVGLAQVKPLLQLLEGLETILNSMIPRTHMPLSQMYVLRAQDVR